MPFAFMKGPPPDTAIVALVNEYVARVSYCGESLLYYLPMESQRLIGAPGNDATFIERFIYEAAVWGRTWERRETAVLVYREIEMPYIRIGVYAERDVSSNTIARALHTVKVVAQHVFYEESWALRSCDSLRPR